MARELSEADTNRLLLWMKANAEEMARDLHDAGWEEDEAGLWRYNGKGRRMHLYDAHALTRGDEA